MNGERRGFQVSFYSLFAAVTFIAVIFAARPDSKQFIFATAVFALEGAACCLLAPSARAIIRSHLDAPPPEPVRGDREEFAYGVGLLCIVPIACVWLFALIQQSSHADQWSGLSGLLGVISLCAWIPILGLLLVSFLLYWGLRQNGPLFTLRVIGLGVNVAWIIIVFVES